MDLDNVCVFAWCSEPGYEVDEMGTKCKGHYEEHQASLAGVPWNREYESIMCTNDWCNEDVDNPDGPHFNKNWCTKQYYYGEKKWGDFPNHPDCKGKEVCEGHVCIFCHDPFYQNRECIDHSKKWFTRHVPREAASCTFCNDKAVRDGLCGTCYNSSRESDEETKVDARKLSLKEVRVAKENTKILEEETIESMVNLEWWLEMYDTQELPAKYMNPDFYRLLNWDYLGGQPSKLDEELAALDKNESRILNELLRELDGTVVDGHVWRFTSKKHFKREGTHNHFAFFTMEEDPGAVE